VLPLILKGRDVLQAAQEDYLKEDKEVCLDAGSSVTSSLISFHAQTSVVIKLDGKY
jgi:hypothetical protein